jgi:predicted nucleic acid-binding protein
MDILVDTGILLRLLIPADALHGEVRRSIKLLRSRGERLVTLTQNISEFWNVCTRPTAARGGYGFTVDEAARKVRLLERLISIKPDSDAAYQEWKNLLVAHAVKGAKAHDARIVAAMKAYGITRLLTLNGNDFKRFHNRITIITPADVA